MPGVREDFHHSAHLVATVWPLQLLLSTAGLGIKLPDQQLGAIRPSLQGPQSIAGPIDAPPVGLPEADESRLWVKTGLAAIASPTLFTAPTSLPGTAQPPAVFCVWRQTRHEASRGRNTEAADSVIGLRKGQDWMPVRQLMAVRGRPPPVRPRRRIARGRFMGLCPLHADRKPSFLLDPNKNFVLLLWLRPWRRCDPLRRVVSRRAVR